VTEERLARPDQEPEAAQGQKPEQEQARGRIAELEDRLLRALADLDNLRKRYGREAGRERAAERARVAAAWLPVVDGLDRAIKHGQKEEADRDGGLVEGIRALRDQAVSILAGLGFPRYDDVGRRFDPSRHEAVGVVVHPEAEPMTVLEAVRPGYGNEQEVLRPAAGVVAGGRQGPDGTPGTA
jgi:molecular chaperone GrpE